MLFRYQIFIFSPVNSLIDISEMDRSFTCDIATGEMKLRYQFFCSEYTRTISSSSPETFSVLILYDIEEANLVDGLKILLRSTIAIIILLFLC